MLEQQTPYLVAFILGLMGSTHCIGMCGGISSSIGLSIDQKPLKTLTLSLLFNIGRINSYLFTGLMVGTASSLFSPNQVMPVLTIAITRTLSGLILIIMALYIGQWWMGLTKLEEITRHLWRYLQPLTKEFLPVNYWHQAFLLGFLWGWIPCGLVYSTLIWASVTARGFDIALLMLCFGLGTIPAMVSATFFANRLKSLLQNRLTRRLLASLLLVFGLWTIIGGNMHFLHNKPHSSTHEHKTQAADKNKRAPAQNHLSDHA